LDAERASELSKFGEEEGKVSVRKGDGRIVNNGRSVGLGAKGVIIGLLMVEKARLRAFNEEGIDLFEEFGEGKGRKEGAEGIALSKALMLEKKSPSTRGSAYPANISMRIEKIKIASNRRKGSSRCKTSWQASRETSLNMLMRSRRRMTRVEEVGWERY
jgi:hypothetical protein